MKLPDTELPDVAIYDSSGPTTTAVTMARSRPISFLVKLTAVGVGTLMLVEAGLRVTGRTPFIPPETESFQGQPRNRFIPDPVVGWIKAPGSYPRERNDEAPKRVIEEHFLPADLRAASPAQQKGVVGDGRPQLLLLGCSFTEGGGLSDEETFAWKIQEKFPQLEVLNMGTSAWSTVQSMLALENIALKEPKMRNIKGVIYNFVDFHVLRNIGLPAWHRALAWINPEGTIALPSCELGRTSSIEPFANGTDSHAAATFSSPGLHCFAPEPYPRFPLRQTLAFSALSEEIWLTYKHRGRAEHRDEITYRVIERMNDDLKPRQIPFHVAYLAKVNADSEPNFINKLKERRIDSATCTHPSQPKQGGSVSSNFILSSNGHPNMLLNQYWADCLESVVERMFDYR